MSARQAVRRSRVAPARRGGWAKTRAGLAVGLPCALGVALCLPHGPARAASDPVYLRVGPDGHPWLSNADESGEATLLLAGHSPQIWSFRQRFRIFSTANAIDHGDVPRRAAALERADRALSALVEAASARAGLDADLVRAVVLVESGFEPAARSPAGALGLMQLIPSTGARFGVRDLLDPGRNLEAGTRYLAYLIRYFDGDVRLALAGYNAGEGAVVKHGFAIPPYPETRAYVPAVLSAWRSFSERTAALGEAALGRAPMPAAATR